MKSRVPLFIGLAVLGLALCLFGFWAIGIRTQKTQPQSPPPTGDFKFPQDTALPAEASPKSRLAAPPKIQPTTPSKPVTNQPPKKPVTKSVTKTSRSRARQPAATKKKPVKKKTAVPTRKWKITYRDTRAQKVSLIGTFNNWNPRKNPLTKGYNHTWSATASLAPGEYHYQFWVDGKARRDPQNPRATTDGKGGKVSVMTIRTK